MGWGWDGGCDVDGPPTSKWRARASVIHKNHTFGMACNWQGQRHCEAQKARIVHSCACVLCLVLFFFFFSSSFLSSAATRPENCSSCCCCGCCCLQSVHPNSHNPRRPCTRPDMGASQALTIRRRHRLANSTVSVVSRYVSKRPSERQSVARWDGCGASSRLRDIAGDPQRHRLRDTVRRQSQSDGPLRVPHVVLRRRYLRKCAQASPPALAPNRSDAKSHSLHIRCSLPRTGPGPPQFTDPTQYYRVVVHCTHPRPSPNPPTVNSNVSTCSATRPCCGQIA
jgi:hypothetical protein